MYRQVLSSVSATLRLQTEIDAIIPCVLTTPGHCVEVVQILDASLLGRQKIALCDLDQYVRAAWMLVLGDKMQATRR